MKYLLLLLAMITSDISYAQTDTLEYYLDNINKKCKPNYAVNFRRAWKEGDWWRVKDYYVSTNNLRSNGVFASHTRDTFETEQGMFYYYHANGKIQKKVRYINGYAEGAIKVYDEEGRLTDSGLFKKGIPYKARYMWGKQGELTFKGLYDESGNGIGEEWEYHADGSLASFGKTGSEHKKDSVWTYYHKNGIVSSVEFYDRDSLITIQCFGEDGKASADSCVAEKMPEPSYNVSLFLSREMRYPGAARENDIQGMATINFSVSEDGRISEIKSIGRHLGGGCDEEALRVVSLLPKWTPAKSHNRPVKVYFNLPISFRLE